MACAFALVFAAESGFVIGKTSSGPMDGVRFIGAQPYASFDAKLKELSAQPK